MPGLPGWLPSSQPAVPIDLLSAALTSKSANVYASTPPPRTRTGRRPPRSPLPVAVNACL
eukprot:5649363-Prymnesium_polylepis.1